ncbi:MAG: hypothetical protein ACI9VR_004518, partial [Cognaticolwellia sp.]
MLLLLSTLVTAAPADQAFFERDAAALHALTESDGEKAWFYLGLMARELGNLEEAEACFRAATASDSAAAWFELGVTLSWMDRSDEALGAVEQALLLDPELPGGRLMQARLLGWTGRFAAAGALLDQLIEQSPEGAELWAARGSLNLAMGAPGAARFDFERALQLAPSTSEATLGLKTLAELRRGTVRVGLEGWRSEDALGAGASASLAYRLRARTAVQAQWRMGVSPQLGSTASTRPIHTGGVGLRLGRGPWGLGLGLQARGGADPWIGAPFSLSRESSVGQWELSWTPGRTKVSQDRRAGLAWSNDLPHQSWTRVQVSTSIGPTGLGYGVSCSVGSQLGVTALRVDLASFKDPAGWLHVAAVGWTVPLSDDHALS